MYKINGHYVYLTNSQYYDIVDKVAGKESADWKFSSHIIGRKENIELHDRIQRYLAVNFKREYYEFDFYNKDAQDNIVSILSEYDELSDAIDIIRADDIDFVDVLKENGTGKFNVRKISIKIYEKIFFSWLFGRKDTGNSITIKIEDVKHVCGELTNFVMESKTFSVRFTTDNVNITYK